MGESLSRLFQRTTDSLGGAASTDSVSASDKDSACSSNNEYYSDSTDSGSTDYTTADEDAGFDFSAKTNEEVTLHTPFQQTPDSIFSLSPQTQHPSHQCPSSQTQLPSHKHIHSREQVPQPSLKQLQLGCLSSSQAPLHQSPPTVSMCQAQSTSYHLQDLALTSQVQPLECHLPPSISSLRAQEAQFPSYQPFSLSESQSIFQSSIEQQFISASTAGDSPESKTLCQHSAELVLAISASDPLVPWQLLAKGLVGQETIDYYQLEVTQTKKSSRIVSAVVKAVSASPHLFKLLVSVLNESSNTALMSVGEKLNHTYELLKKMITETPCHSHCFHTHPHYTPSMPPLLQTPICHYANYLRAVYNRSELPEYSNPACYKWMPSPGKKFKFINLSLISKEEIATTEADSIKREIIHGRIDFILKKKSAVAIENILQAEHGKLPTCVLIEGAPGVGKSTLAWEICRCWGRYELQEYSIVLLVMLRDKRVQRATCVVDLFYHSDKKLQEEVIQEIYRINGKGVLILLEGLDELPECLLTECSIFTDLLSGVIFPEATLLVTSRPSATDKLWQRWWAKKSYHFKILGFTEDNINEYSKSVLSDHQLSGFSSYLSIHPHIKSMMYIPLHCAIATAVYLQCQQSDRPPPKTLTGLYTFLVQTILLQYLQDSPDYQGKHHQFDSFFELPAPVFTHFKRLCSLAFDGVDKQQLVFHNLPQSFDTTQQFDHLGFMDAVPELFLFSAQSTSYSYNFLHLSVQEYLAAYHVSLMNLQEQEQLLQTVRYGDHRFNMTRFLAGITQLKHLNKDLVKNIIGIERKWGARKNMEELSSRALDFLYECQDMSILDNKCCYYAKIQCTDSVHRLMTLGYCIAMSNAKWYVSFSGRDNSGTEILCHSLKENPHPNYSIEYIEYKACAPDFTHQVLQQLPEYALRQIKKISIQHDEIQALPSCLPKLILRMEKLNTLTLGNILDVSLTDLLPALSRVSTLRNLTLSGVNIALPCQWLPTYQLDKLMLLEKHKTLSAAQELTVFFCDNSIEAIVSLCSTTGFLDQILTQIPPQSIANVKTLTIHNENMTKHLLPLPPCLPEVILRMEKLFTLTLENVLDTSLTELIPSLSRVPTLRNMTLPRLNSRGMALLCQWLPTCPLEKLTLLEKTEATTIQELIIIFHNNVIDTIVCQYCTCEFLDQILPVVPQECMASIKTLTVHMHSEIKHVEYYDDDYEDNKYEFEDEFENEDKDEDDSHCILLPLPSCLPELIPQMETLDTLTLKNVLDNSLTMLIPILSRVPTLRNLTLPKLNSRGIALLCQWLPTCQLEKLIICKEILHINEVTPYDQIMVATFSDFSIEAMEFQQYAPEIIDQVLSHIPQQSLVCIKTLSIGNEYIDYCQPLPIPPCLPGLIPKMERLNTLSVENGVDTLLTELILALQSRVSTLRNLTLHKLNSKGLALLYEWLRTCQLQKLKLLSLSPDHIDMVSRALATVSSLKTLGIEYSGFTLQSMQAFVFLLQQNQSITEVNISRCSVYSDSSCYLAKALHHNTALRNLHMNWIQVGEKETRAMAEMLQHNTTLEELNFINAKISSNGAIAVAEALHHNLTLRKLDMSRNPIGEEGALAMAEMLKHNTTLEELNLSDKIGNNGIKALVESLAVNQYLKKLIISDRYKKFVTSFLPLYSSSKERVHFVGLPNVNTRTTYYSQWPQFRK